MTRARTTTASGSTTSPRLLVLGLCAAFLAGGAPVAEAAHARTRSTGYDLVVTDVRPTTGGTQAVGSPVLLSATIRNAGTAPTPAGIVHGVAFSVDGRVVSCSDTHVSALPPGGAVTVTANGGPAGRATWTASTGTHALAAHVDDVNRLRNEVDERNNTRRSSVTAAAVQPVTDVSARPAMTQEQFAAAPGKDVVVSWRVPVGQPVGTQYVVTEHPADDNAGICDPSESEVKTSTPDARATATMTTGGWCYGHTYGNRVVYTVEARAGSTTAVSQRSGVCEWSNAFDTYGGGLRTWQLACAGAETLSRVEGPSSLTG